MPGLGWSDGPEGCEPPSSPPPGRMTQSHRRFKTRATLAALLGGSSALKSGATHRRNRAALLSMVADRAGSVTAHELVTVSGLPRRSLARYLAELTSVGAIQRIGWGRYAIPTPPPSRAVGERGHPDFTDPVVRGAWEARWKARYASSYADRDTAIRRMIRVEVLIFYGGDPPECWCCGEPRMPFLTLDHIDGGGTAHRRKFGPALAEWLRSQGFPPGVRVLCANCNTARGHWGFCPHDSERGL
jgi:hypothetical protein